MERAALRRYPAAAAGRHAVYPGKGRLNFAATAIDTRLGTQQLRAEFDNPQEQLLPGQFVTVRITAGQRDNVFLVPQTAVIQTEKANLVFVVDARRQGGVAHGDRRATGSARTGRSCRVSTPGTG